MPQQVIRRLIRARAAALRDLARAIHQAPEPGLEEVKASAWQRELLAANGFQVRAGTGGLPTAFRAAFGAGKPVLAICSEYDALPGIGHGCGHNLIAACAVGAGLALADLVRQKRLKGTVVVLGTPAEESKGGKVLMLKGGAFRGVDAAIMAHPSWRSVPDKGCTAIRRFKVSFHGQASHAAAAPELGRNALDAVMLLFQGINAWRQQMPDGVRVHGIVDRGGALPNIIPDLAACTFFLRAGDDRTLDGMERRFRAMVRGAGLMTDTRPRIAPWLLPYKARRPNAPFNEVYWEAAVQAGLNPVNPAQGSKGSTDFGDVSQAMPGAHVYFGIARHEIPGHSPQFARAAGSVYGLDQMLKMAEVLAVMGARFLADAGFRKRVHADFRRRA
jgi:amidohydrolase